MGNWKEWGAWANAIIETGNIRWNAVESDYVQGWGGYGAGFGLLQFTSSAIQVLNYIATHGGDINLIPAGNLKTAIQNNNGSGYNGISSGATNSPGPYTPAETEGLHKFLDTEPARKAQSAMVQDFYYNHTAGSMDALQKTFPTNDMAKCLGMRVATNYGNALLYCQGNSDSTPIGTLIQQADSFSQWLHAQKFVDLLTQNAGDFSGLPPVNVWNYGGGGSPSPNPPKPSKPGGNTNTPNHGGQNPKPKPVTKNLKPGILNKELFGYSKLGEDVKFIRANNNQMILDFDNAKQGGSNNSNGNQNSGSNPKPKPDPTPPPTPGTSLKAELDNFYNQYKGTYIQNGQCVGLTSAWLTHLSGGVYGLTPWNSQTANPNGTATANNKHFDYQQNIPGTPANGWGSAAQIGSSSALPPGWHSLVPQKAEDCKAGDIFYVGVDGVPGTGHTGIVFADGSNNVVPTIEQNFNACPVQYFAGGAYTSWGLYPWFEIWRKD